MTKPYRSRQPLRIAILGSSEFYNIGLRQLLETKKSNVEVESFKTQEDWLQRHEQIRFRVMIIHVFSKWAAGELKKVLVKTNSRKYKCRVICYFTEFDIDVFTMLCSNMVKYFFYIKDKPGEIIRIITSPETSGPLLSDGIARANLALAKQIFGGVSFTCTFTSNELEMLQLLVLEKWGLPRQKSCSPASVPAVCVFTKFRIA